ncbi:XdhC family protein [Roseovarius sp. C7]|uniref:XdhC family protein n=1 Tax=Roseovarius sp. C7 TaxID=3398643 RepID=UPI0039F66E24
MMDQASAFSFSTIDVLRAADRESVLAIIVGTKGPSYRPVGAVMRFFADGTSIGTLSSGCIEADLALQAHNALSTERPKLVRYGQGSPFMDIKLPCGGGLDIFLLPRPCEATLGALVRRLENRRGAALCVDLKCGALSLSEADQTHRTESGFAVYYAPDPRFIVFGKGPEAAMFTALAETLGFPNVLLSPDCETLEMAGPAAGRRLHLPRPALPEAVSMTGRALCYFFSMTTIGSLRS